MKRFGARWKLKDGVLLLRWKKRKVKGVHYCPAHGGNSTFTSEGCVFCVPPMRKVKDAVCFDLPDYGDETRPG